LILDIRREPNDLDRIMYRWLRKREILSLAVLTKTDKMKRGEIARSEREIRYALDISPDETLLFSAKTGTGRDALAGWIRSIGQR